MMVDPYATKAFDERDEYPKVTQEDLDRATFRVGLDVVIEKGEAGLCDAPEPTTREWLRVAKSAFEFWDNPIDAAYDV